MRLLLIGYGKMGKAIEQVALQRGHHVVYKIGLSNITTLAAVNPKEVDMALEFSQPTAAYSNICQCLAKNIPVLSGTTGWLDKKEALYAYCKAHGGTFFYASNFSIGMNILFKVNTYLAKLMDRQPEYEVTLAEQHHLEKKDTPSGTAITLAEGIIQNMHRKKTWELAPKRQQDSVGIVAARKQDIPGTHTITYTAPQDTLELKHTAHSRQGFALGAVLVAEWLKDKQGIFGMEDFLQLADC
ncbi:MAG: 4-hydroxy-tetrahydrodipicolinate reductase [Bacteroidota bacterium]